MSENLTVGNDNSDGESVWRPPTVGVGKLLWYITPSEFDKYQQGELSYSELETRVERRHNRQPHQPDFRGGAHE